jgi:hypothetical protein
MNGWGMKLGAVVVMTLVAANALPSPALASPQAAACHSRVRHQSSLKSIDYSCCQSEHNSALVKTSVDAATPILTHQNFEVALTVSYSAARPALKLLLSGSPPVSPPLLI